MEFALRVLDSVWDPWIPRTEVSLSIACVAPVDHVASHELELQPSLQITISDLKVI